MKKYIDHWILLIVFVCFVSNVQAQIGTGLILEDEAYNSSSLVPQSFAGGKLDVLPLKTSLKDHCPKITNQGQIGSCVGWSSGYGAFTIMRAKEEGWTDVNEITENAFSALYIYNQVKIGDCYQGSLFSAALKLLKTQGDCLSNEFDFPKDDCEKIPTEAIKTTAKKNPYEVRDYFTLFKSTETVAEKIRQTKVSLSEGKPVIIGMMIRENFKDLEKEDKYWDPENGNTSSSGGHAMVVVGYNDGKKAFEIMNSWGTEWGNDGYCWVKYEDFGKYCVYGYQLLIGKKMIDNETDIDPFAPTPSKDERMSDAGKKSKLDLSAQFAFRYPSDYDDDKEEIIYEESKIKLNGGYYTLNCDLGQQFQLVTRKITKDRYVYVFSIDPENVPKIHWPRSEKYNQKFFGLDEGAIVPYKNLEIVMPGKDKGLIKDKEGKDYLFVLYSYKPIDDLVDRVKEMTNGEGNYLSRLQATFGKRLVPTNDIDYSSDKMEFTTSSTSGGYIIPILLEVDTK